MLDCASVYGDLRAVGMIRKCKYRDRTSTYESINAYMQYLYSTPTCVCSYIHF